MSTLNLCLHEQAAVFPSWLTGNELNSPRGTHSTTKNNFSLSTEKPTLLGQCHEVLLYHVYISLIQACLLAACKCQGRFNDL